MKSPRQIAADLRSLASKIERSNKPSKTLVASAIKRVLVAMEDPDTNNDVNKLSYDHNSLLNEGFDGDSTRLEQAWTEFEELCSGRGINVPNRKPGSVWISCPTNAFNELSTLLEESASERPDDDLDLLLAYLHGAKVDPVA